MVQLGLSVQTDAAHWTRNHVCTVKGSDISRYCISNFSVHPYPIFYGILLGLGSLKKKKKTYGIFVGFVLLPSLKSITTICNNMTEIFLFPCRVTHWNCMPSTCLWKDSSKNMLDSFDKKWHWEQTALLSFVQYALSMKYFLNAKLKMASNNKDITLVINIFTRVLKTKEIYAHWLAWAKDSHSCNYYIPAWALLLCIGK